MFLIERIIGVGAYSCALFGFSGYLLFNKKAKASRVINVYLIVIVLLAFLYCPDQAKDLYRLQIEVQSWMNYSWKQIVNIAFGSSIPVWYLYGYAIGKTGIQGLLPGMTALVVYGNVFAVIKKSSDRFKLSNREIAKVIFCFMSAGSMFMITISNIRTMFGMSIVCLCIYQEMIEGKSVYKNAVKYLIAMLIHQVVVTVVLVRFGFYLIESVDAKKNVLATKVFRILGVIVVALAVAPFALNILQSVQSKAENYLSKETYEYIWEYIIGGVNFFAVLVSIIQAFKIENDIYSLKIKNICKYMVLISLPMIVFSFEYSIFRRYELFLSMLWCILLAFNMSSGKRRMLFKVSSRFEFSYVDLMMMLGTLQWGLSCVRGDLCGYKFFEI